MSRLRAQRLGVELNQLAADTEWTADEYAISALTYDVIKHDYFGMPYRRLRNGQIADPTDGNDWRFGEIPRGWRFNKIKTARYNSISASVSQAVHRLEKRGLIHVRTAPGLEDPLSRAKIRLTDEGLAVAHSLNQRAEERRRISRAKFLAKIPKDWRWS